MTVENVLYKTTMQSSGGREGSSRAADGSLELILSTPKELGGNGGDRHQSGTAVCRRI